jgi:uncharacterized membrane protein YciS (DUF1049 family)
MRHLVRIVVLLVVAIAVGWMVDKAMLRRNSVAGAYQAEVRLGAATAGLFAAGVVVTVVGIGMALGRKK